MWQAYTERCRRVIFYAQEVAAELDQRLVAPEHLYLGLLREGNSNAVDMLEKRGIDRLQLTALILEQCKLGDWRRHIGDMELSDASKHVLDVTYAVARDASFQRGDSVYVGTEHLLAALIEHTGIGALPTEEEKTDAP